MKTTKISKSHEQIDGTRIHLYADPNEPGAWFAVVGLYFLMRRASRGELINALACIEREFTGKEE